MHRFPDWIIAAERKRDVAYSAAYLGERQVLLDPSRRFDEIHGVAVVLFNAGGDGQYVGIENNVLGWESNLLGEDLVRAGTNLDLAFIGVGLPEFVERHHDNRRAVTTDQLGL